jgi:CRP-like cAMP-binding protein
MALDQLLTPLERVPLFVGLSPEQLGEIARHAERITFRPGEVITRAGERGFGAYLLVAGRAECAREHGEPTQEDVVVPGSLIGELAMLVEHTYGTTVIARERVHCLKILRLTLSNQMLTDPALANHLERQLTSRLERVAEDLRRIDHMLATAAQGRRPSSAAPESTFRQRLAQRLASPHAGAG